MALGSAQALCAIEPPMGHASGRAKYWSRSMQLSGGAIPICAGCKNPRNTTDGSTNHLLGNSPLIGPGRQTSRRLPLRRHVLERREKGKTAIAEDDGGHDQVLR